MYAIVDIAGKQYKVREDDKLYVPRREADAGDELTFDRVLLVADGDDIRVGTPTVPGASVTATVLREVKADKILVFKKIRRKRFKVKRGHRQRYTHIQIGSLSLGEKGAKAEKEEEAAPAEA